MMMRTGARHIWLISAGAVIGAIGMIDTITPGLAQSERTSSRMSKPGNIEGRVADVVEVPGYTYVEVETIDGNVWVAAPSVLVEVGDTVSFSSSMPMQDFYSKTLQREFSILYFVDRFVSGGAVAQIDRDSASAHGSMVTDAPVRPVQNFARAGGGYTISEIYTRRDELQGHTIRVRGQVVKFTTGVLGTNWARITDNSAADVLVVPVDETLQVDDVVLIEGRLVLNRDLGQGYVIPVIVEDAAIIVE